MGDARFRVTSRSGRARAGRLDTAHGAFSTPAFMPVGTHAAVKAVLPRELIDCGAEVVLSNTYHLWLRPGHETVRGLGGLHRFMGWSGPILTDSGGFQVLSLSHLNRVDENGARFRSHLDGTDRLLTPEVSMEVQAALGSDIAMVLDVCPALPAPREAIEAAVERTTRWAARSREAFRGAGLVFGIVQGGGHEDLRERSARELIALDFPGYAIGGVSVGESREAIRRTVSHAADLLPDARPRYLMGVGRPRDLLDAIACGVDMFDCVMPTRNARNGTLFTSTGRINIKRAEFRDDPRPLDETCPCEACRGFSRAYLRHLYRSNEMLGLRLHTLHNLTYYLGLMRRAREAIAEDRFAELRARYLEREQGGDP